MIFKDKLAVIGLGYVGLPLAIAFSKKMKVLGFDIDKNRIKNLKKGIDSNNESVDEITSCDVHFTSNEENLKETKYFIITVPTPVNKAKVPNMNAVINATKLVSKYISKDSFIIYESTFYPGVTEEICLPIIEKISGKKCNNDFFLGYSPERVNPGDKSKKLESIVKIISGSCSYASKHIDELYSKIIKVGTCRVNSIKIAEAAKVIENIQRDVNIALVNELSIIFRSLGIDTQEVLDAASTKWNFHKYSPGLVGGHCIGVDPFYLKFKANQIGVNTHMISAGRFTNDAMASYVASIFIKKLFSKVKVGSPYKIIILGITFKENCSDIRNSKIFEVIKELESFGCQIDIHDPYADNTLVKQYYGIEINYDLKEKYYDGIILAVSHKYYLDKKIGFIKSLGKSNSVFFDLKSNFDIEESDLRL